MLVKNRGHAHPPLSHKDEDDVNIRFDNLKINLGPSFGHTSYKAHIPNEIYQSKKGDIYAAYKLMSK